MYVFMAHIFKSAADKPSSNLLEPPRVDAEDQHDLEYSNPASGDSGVYVTHSLPSLLGK